MKLLLGVICMLACALVMVPPGSYGQESTNTNPSIPCSVSVRALTAPAPLHDGGDRRNPDRSLYPGDATHYFFAYRGSDTCLSFKVNGLESYGSATVLDHNVANAINITGLAPDEPWPELNVRNHRHGTFEVNVEWIDKTEDEPAHVEWSTPSASHGRHGTPEYEDAESIDGFFEFAKNRCTSDRVHAGCAWGHAEIDMGAVNKICLHETMRSEGIRIPEGLRDECKNRNYITMSVEGDGKRCSKNENGGWDCERVTRTSTATVRLNILEPQLDLTLTKPPLYDAYGFESQNLDGTYYLDDPVHVLHHPEFKWKDDRGGAIKFVVYRHWCPDEGECTRSERAAQLPIIKAFDCKDDRCDRVFSIPRHTDTTWSLGNGDGQTAYMGTVPGWYGNNTMKYRIEAYNIEIDESRMLNLTHADTWGHIVGYDPVFESITYPVLADDGQLASDNRFAMASRYFGSWGGESGDANMTEPYEYRRARIDAAYGGVIGYYLVNSSTLAGNLVWSEAPRTPPHVLDYGAQDYPGTAFYSTSAPIYPGIVPLSDKEAAVWPKAGYGRIFFDFPDMAKYEIGGTRALYYNATAYVYTFALDFAGEDFIVMEAEPYIYPDATFNHGIIIKSVGADGNIRPISLTLESIPRTELGAILLSDYIHEKMMYDLDDVGFADLAVYDTYPMELDIQTESGYIDSKIRRTSSWFPKFTHDAHIGEEGPGAPDKVNPSELLAPVADQITGLFGPSLAPPDDGALQGLFDLFGFFTETTSLSEPLSDDPPARNADIEALMRLVNATAELGYSGPSDLALASYWAYPDTARQNVPLATGLTAPSPLNVTYGNEFNSYNKSLAMPSFEGNVVIQINSDQNNVMNATRHDEVLVIYHDDNFGPILYVEINGDQFPTPVGLEGRCVAGCAVNVGWGSVTAIGYNQWNGTTHFYSEAQVPPPPYEPEEVDYNEVFLVIAIVVVGIILAKLINNRVDHGIWSLRA